MTDTRHSRLITQLERHEGCRLDMYEDTTGHYTIGIGRNLEDVGLRDKEEAHYLLVNDICHVEDELNDLLGNNFDGLNSPRKNVIVNMAFNLGIAGLMEFEKMWSAIDNDDWEKASAEMLDSQWSIQVGARANELAEQMREGKYQDNG